MKLTYNILCIIFFSLYTLSCNTIDHENEIIDNNIYFETITYDGDLSRSDFIKKTSFEANDTILFISYGNHPNNSTLAYNGKEWNSSKKLKWNSDSYDSIHYTAFYPASENSRYTRDMLYKNGMLKDILFCKSSNKYKDKISLNFKHMFSVVNIDFKDLAKRENIKFIEISFPASVDSIETHNGTIHINNDKATLFTIIPGKSNDCSIVVPPTDGNAINIKIKTADTIYKKQISPFSYKQGNIYTYNIIKQNNNKGIRTADDFIAFTFLINGIEYKDRSLDEFYYTENGNRIFSLINNISFSEEECKQLKIIGSKSAVFNDIFDGNGHILCNLDFCNNNGSKALFNYIGENGIVRNIIIENSCVHSTKNNEIALLACRNLGLIDNCLINECELNSDEVRSCCFIAYYNKGAIINSKVCNSTIKGNKQSCNSVISKNLEGIIINSYSSDNQLTYSSTGSVSGFVHKISKDSQIKNCYVKCSSDKKTKVYQYITDYDDGFEVDYCFVSNNIPPIDKNKEKYGFMVFNNSFNVTTSGKDVVEILNEWIDNNQIYYPQYKFKKWKRNTEFIPAIHID